jgi:glycosyltransferase involved in cell wall biosynthesis
MDNAVRIAVDARDLAHDTRGIGRYTRAVLRRLVSNPSLQFTMLLYGLLPGRGRKELSATLASGRFRVAGSPRGCDAVWHPANGTFFKSGLRSIVTIHDAVPFRFSDADRKRREHRQAPFLRSVRTASRFIAVSQFGKRELIDVFGLQPERIEVIYHGVDKFFAPGPANVPPALRDGPYLLFVGDTGPAEPRKNFPLLYDAYRRAFPDLHPRLAVVGPNGPQLEGVYYAGVAAGDASGSGDAFLRDLYRGALALCVPSYHETFGMPVVEAMACGTPAIVSNASCLPEIAGDAALYANPHDAQSWAKALADLAASAELRARLRERGLAQARKYDWDVSAAKHAELFIDTARASTAPTS